ncbi:WAT1-related protein At4g08290-like isoform X5 [Asparagus officinalis]|uniref:WAT1-related protein At4g08290-like isoform X5 n=1 Tax=Asparagus officinalis TaxID=4686 RepID=UPI00098E7CC2|nr:WAT1-related protein At4g08290-like isoform X5 [Asparagus officinalis]
MNKLFQMGGMYKRLKAHLLMTLAQIGYTLLYFITEASFNRGMNPHVYITYRHVVGGFVMLPFAYFLERRMRPKLTWALFWEIFVLSLLGLEKLDFKSPRGIAKIVGTLVSLAGVTIMTLYKGPAVKNLWEALIHIQGSVVHESWVKGSILTVVSCITWSIWYIMQAVTLKRYPAQLSLTTWMNFVGGAQSAVFTVCVAHKPADWALRLDINLWSILYGGVVCSGLIIFIQLWCTKEKGPVFVTMFNPVATILVAVLAYVIFGEKLYTGSITGGVIVIIGLYLVLWGKEKDLEPDGNSQKPAPLANDEQKEASNDSTIYIGGKV